jgi:hypothetical protein
MARWQSIPCGRNLMIFGKGTADLRIGSVAEALVVQNAEASAVAGTIDRVDPSVRPDISPGLAAELKFSECLPPQIASAVVEGRLSDRAAFDEALRRPRRVITAAS